MKTKIFIIALFASSILAAGNELNSTVFVAVGLLVLVAVFFYEAVSVYKFIKLIN